MLGWLNGFARAGHSVVWFHFFEAFLTAACYQHGGDRRKLLLSHHVWIRSSKMPGAVTDGQGQQQRRCLESPPRRCSPTVSDWGDSMEGNLAAMATYAVSQGWWYRGRHALGHVLNLGLLLWKFIGLSMSVFLLTAMSGGSANMCPQGTAMYVDCLPVWHHLVSRK